MKYCPTCNTRYDEDILRFCMKDGTPLVEEEEPKFIEMPSESLEDALDDDPAEVTVIRRNVPVPKPPPIIEDELEFAEKEEPAPRIVVPMAPEPIPHRTARTIPRYQSPPKSNTLRTVILTMIGTTALLGLGALGLWMLQSDPVNNTNTNTNVNTNVNTNLNTNLGLDGNFNFNINTNIGTNANVNTNANANLKTPTPTPKPSPSITPSPSPTPDEDATPTPTRTPIPAPSPIIIRPGTSPTPGANPTPRVPPRTTATPSV